MFNPNLIPRKFRCGFPFFHFFELFIVQSFKALNEAAVRRSRKGENMLLAFSDVGINKTTPKKVKTEKKLSIPLCEREG